MSGSRGLYIHVPFCASVCAYCDFYRFRYNEEKAAAWAKEAVFDLNQIQGSVDTIYIGGGTPSVLSEETLKSLLESVQRFLPVKEFTVECNPESVTPEKIRLLKENGVNRISLGAQAFDDGILGMLGRKHDAAMIRNAVGICRAEGIGNISLDLMYSLPGQTVQDWKKTLEEAVKTGVPHLSVYSLTVEEGSLFYRQGKTPSDPDTETAMYDTAITYLEENGYRQYEVSNFAKDGRESLHNKIYWHYEDFIGVGPGASGKENGVRYTNNVSLNDYIKGKRRREEIPLSEEDERFEAVMMGLRLREGINLAGYREKYGVSLETRYAGALEKHVKAENLVIEDGFLRTTKRGMFVLHDVLVDFLD